MNDATESANPKRPEQSLKGTAETMLDIVDEQSEMPWFDRVFQWCEDRNLIKGSNPAKQYGKLLEEMAELYQAINAGDQEGIKDAIGDCYVVLACMCGQIDCEWPTWGESNAFYFVPPECGMDVLVPEIANIIRLNNWDSASSFGYPCKEICITLERMAMSHGLTREECMEHAWNEIRFRTGYTDPRIGIFVKNADMPEELKGWMAANE